MQFNTCSLKQNLWASPRVFTSTKDDNRPAATLERQSARDRNSYKPGQVVGIFFSTGTSGATVKMLSRNQHLSSRCRRQKDKKNPLYIIRQRSISSLGSAGNWKMGPNERTSSSPNPLFPLSHSATQENPHLSFRTSSSWPRFPPFDSHLVGLQI